MKIASWPESLSARDPYADSVSAGTLGGRTPSAVEPAGRIPSIDDMIRVAADFAPGAGNEAPDRVLGPWADELDVRKPTDRDVLRVAVASACFFAPDDDARSPFEQWCRRAPVPPASERAALRAVDRAPWGLWACVAEQQGGFAIEDRVGLPSRHLPVGPVAIAECPAIGSSDRRGWGALLAKLVLTEQGWRVALGFVMAEVPPDRVVSRWLDEIVGPGRLRIDEGLRSRGHVLVRRACEWRWLAESGRGRSR